MQLGPLIAEITNPESEKFTAALLLVHGLWERAVTWRRFAGYLSHRGWRCLAVERRAQTTEVAAQAAELRLALAALDAPPIIVGHDLGAVLALSCCDAARAVVALAPLVGPPLGPPPVALRHAGSWLARRRGAALAAPRGRWSTAYPERSVAEPAALVGQIVNRGCELATPRSAAPRAVFAAEQDEVTPLSAAQALAQRADAELQVLHGSGHALLSAPGWETSVAAIHRWMIRHSGVDLLALYDEAMQDE